MSVFQKQMWFHLREAPVAWQSERNRDFISRIMQAVSVSLISLGAFSFYQALFSSAPDFNRMGALVTTSGVIGLGTVHVSRVSQLSCEGFYKLAFICLCLIACPGKYLYVGIEDKDIRNRVMVIGHMVWPSFPTIMGFRFKESAIFMIWLFAHLVASSLMCGVLHKEIVHWRYFFFQLIWHVTNLCIGCFQQVFLRELYDVQQQLNMDKEELWTTQKQLRQEKDALHKALEQLRFEKEASESLLCMVCDSCLWLSTDGDTVVRSDAQWHSIVGPADSTGVVDSLSARIPQQDRTRLKHMLEGEAVGSSKSPVRMLPISLLANGHSEPVNVDLFIVDRCRESESTYLRAGVSTDDTMPPGYLLGIRLTEAFAGMVSAAASTRHFPVVAPAPSSVTIGYSTSKTAMTTSECMSESDEAASRAVRQALMLTRNLHYQIDDTDDSECRPPPYGADFQPCGVYLMNVMETLVHDITESMNFEIRGCCAFHYGLSRLSEVIQKLSNDHACATAWPRCRTETWQCSTCTAIMDGWDDSCWICRLVLGFDFDGTSDLETESRGA